ncbi:PIG-L deacetylase family protein [Nesterenkonia alkaliphila]|uniref:PIG-L family deacetylase n=1 Tax=Nesterenkonia alkaliphila TaxID=1463631 RepID=A0A7K1UKD0_9MICC|nr:PIG-L deacetylase family protein [Nesterenkonia alkaliphila]MVT26874.1 PIG-L family deacetylase [Nesterenkonia alkaliphila]GFZ82252.1 GlcNAc-PI de-N-acetylase [Nesterenkonia alkaliphila]
MSRLHTPDELVEELGLHTVLAVAAHPDDIDFGASGTIAALTSRGVQVQLCLLTAGDAGGFDAQRSPEETARLRRTEQEAAAAVVGISEVTLLQERDGFVAPSYELIGHLVRLMRQLRPEAVLSFHPERAWDRLQKSHPDHLATGEAVVRAAYPYVENPFAYPELEAEGLKAFKIQHLLLMGAPQERVNLRVDITGFQDRKLTALDRHLSQHRDAQRMREFVMEQLRASHGAGGYAEEFHHVLVNDPQTISGF